MMRDRARIQRAPAVLGLALAVVLPAQLMVAVARSGAEPVAAAPPTVFEDLTETFPLPPTHPTPTIREPAPPPPPAVRGPRVFGGLGVWVDVYDFAALDPVTTMREVARRGVRTLYIQTGRYNTASRVAPEVGPWLVAAHAEGISVVGWYLPSYANVKRDVVRTLAIESYRYQGHAFDGIGVDIELKSEVPNPVRWNKRVVNQLERVRAGLRTDIPVASIPPPPLQMDVAPLRWAGFPWRGIAEHSDAILLMSYWSYRSCPTVPDHCARPFTAKNIELTRSLTGRPDLPIHTIGGVGDRVNTREIRDFVRGALEADAFGASIYDLRTTAPSFWRHLEELAAL